MLSEEKKAIEYLTKYIHWETYGERSLETDIKIVLNLLDKKRKEIEELKQEKEYLNCIIESDEDNYINKDKIRDYFAPAIAFKRRLIRENEEISDYNRGKFDTIEDLLERLEDNKWN